MVLFLVSVGLVLVMGGSEVQALSQGSGWQENLSLKAGPTEPGEGLSLAWVEAMIYPKVIKEDKMISLGVRLASKVKAVEASFDFTSQKIGLASKDGMFWSNVYTVPAGLSSGVHVVRYQISGAKGSIQRTVEFYVQSPVSLAQKGSVQRKETLAVSSWPLTVTSTCAALTGTSSRIIQAGQKLTGLAKMAWYKVIFDDGQEGWLPSTRVKEPTDDYYLAGYKAYKNGDYAGAVKNYQNSVTVDPDFVKGYLWLAKSYAAQGDLDSAAETLSSALRLDGRDMDCRIFASNLAQKYYLIGHSKYRVGRYSEAVAAFRKAVELKPASIMPWLEMGQSLSRIGFASEARNAWREALKYDPENRELHALLNTNYQPVAASQPGPVTVAAVKADSGVVPMLSDDSLKILRSEKTRKGTSVETAIKSVLAMTRSLGNPIVEKGWQIRKQGEKFLVSYLCQQNGGALESFDWLVDVDTRRVLPHNDNARLLMSRW
jgi:tetratricopeptide (TPR) repeat protein